MTPKLTGEGGDEEEVKKKPLQFSAINSDFSAYRHENKSCSECPDDQLKPF